MSDLSDDSGIRIDACERASLIDDQPNVLGTRRDPSLGCSRPRLKYADKPVSFEVDLSQKRGRAAERNPKTISSKRKPGTRLSGQLHTRNPLVRRRIDSMHGEGAG